jgi:RNA polymerase sigma factor (sigma-70 family)
MAPPDATPSPEQPILRARARGEVSADESFEQLYDLYARVVRAWAVASVRGDEVDDTFQDVWAVFYRRWLSWQLLPEMETPEARPVLSFLYRTFRFVREGNRRRAARAGEQLDAVEAADGRDPEAVLRRVELDRCLELARGICSPEEFDILLAKLAGVSAREIARALSVTEPVVDHRYRSAIARLQKRLRTAVHGGKRGPDE